MTQYQKLVNDARNCINEMIEFLDNQSHKSKLKKIKPIRKKNTKLNIKKD